MLRAASQGQTCKFGLLGDPRLLRIHERWLHNSMMCSLAFSVQRVNLLVRAMDSKLRPNSVLINLAQLQCPKVGCPVFFIYIHRYHIRSFKSEAFIAVARS